MTDNSFWGDLDLHLFFQGTHYEVYKKMGAHPVSNHLSDGYHFSVWAPNATKVSVVGDFNYWSKDAAVMSPQGSSGIWYAQVKEARSGQAYKFHIENEKTGYSVQKADPYSRLNECPPKTASVLCPVNEYVWKDESWISQRHNSKSIESPLSIYEVHLGSWRKVPEEGGRSLTYLELSEILPHYVKDLGFTHVEFLPPMEHPFEGSWGYQVTGYFSPSSRGGNVDDFKVLIDSFHAAGIGVILDWVPAHFPNDEHGLSYFDGTHLYEHADPRKGFHPDWQTLIFNYGRNEVVNFLISNALFWYDEFHIDGLRVDAVASMLYLDYSREGDQWIPNQYGGRENIEAIEFMKHLNTIIYEKYPSVMMIAEESTAWPKVTGYTSHGGLGFGYKWNMGWMHDSLEYFKKDPVYRSHHHAELTFGLLYAFSENFILPLSHDEVVHGKGSLINKMPGDDWQKFANLRLLLSFMYTHPGKKLLFMGSEFAQSSEWNHQQSLDWHLRQYEPHEGIWHLVQDLNNLLKSNSALYQCDNKGNGFEWLDCTDSNQSILSFIRKGHDRADDLVIVLNATPIPRDNYILGVPLNDSETVHELFNSNAGWYGGTNDGNMGKISVNNTPSHGRSHSISVLLPALSLLIFGRK